MIYAHIRQSAPVDAARLHAHADAIEHAAARGGWVDAEGERVPLSEPERAAWMRDAAVIREHAHAMESHA